MKLILDDIPSIECYRRMAAYRPAAFAVDRKDAAQRSSCSFARASAARRTKILESAADSVRRAIEAKRRCGRGSSVGSGAAHGVSGGLDAFAVPSSSVSGFEVADEFGRASIEFDETDGFGVASAVSPVFDAMPESKDGFDGSFDVPDAARNDPRAFGASGASVEARAVGAPVAVSGGSVFVGAGLGGLPFAAKRACLPFDADALFAGDPESSWSLGALRVLDPYGSKRVYNSRRTNRILPKSLPNGSVLHLGENIQICSPELLFLLMARSLSFPDLVLFGCELCGTYAPSLESDDGIVQRCALTTASRLASYVAKMPGVHGVARARRVVPYVLDGSASPREAKLALLLSLPCRYGGFGLEKPMLNYQIKSRRMDGRLLGSESYYCDLYWPSAKLAVEYDSDARHASADRIRRDSKRRAALNQAGVTVLTVTAAQFDGIAEMERIARIAALALKARRSTKRFGCTEARERLHAALLRADWAGRPSEKAMRLGDKGWRDFDSMFDSAFETDSLACGGACYDACYDDGFVDSVAYEEARCDDGFDPVRAYEDDFPAFDDVAPCECFDDYGTAK